MFLLILFLSCKELPKIEDHIRMEAIFQKIELDMTREEVEVFFNDWEITDLDDPDLVSSGNGYVLKTKEINLTFRYYLKNKVERLLSISGLYTDKTKNDWYINLSEKKWKLLNE